MARTRWCQRDAIENGYSTRAENSDQCGPRTMSGEALCRAVSDWEGSMLMKNGLDESTEEPQGRNDTSSCLSPPRQSETQGKGSRNTGQRQCLASIHRAKAVETQGKGSASPPYTGQRQSERRAKAVPRLHSAAC